MADDPLKAKIAVPVAARLVGVTERRVQQLATDGFIRRPYTIEHVVQGYVAFLQDDARKRTKSSASAEVNQERARRLRLENDELEGSLIRRDDALAAVDAIVGMVKSELAGVAPRVTDDVELRRKVEDGIDGVLAQLTRRLVEAGAALRAGRDALGTNAEDDAEPVGGEQQDLSADGGAPGPA